ncbi:class I SAM-dependent methyltransferase [Mobilicoccus pelagius]|uniref:Methyltransferase n=1 Tax=Mobilicoccus pelagius NBRC 104925 TaxID=1089455 RepID=H5UVL9_9MICO|nr:class I SAM-dependent methyltransferase [Mobilicoccus pelagius]GAB49777.1 hypothetical protein MOPEL_135_00150 [Mobilicoccus pelagius NBRC 104925]
MTPISAKDSTVAPAFDEVGLHYDRLTGMSPGYAAQLRSSARVLTGMLARRPAPGEEPLQIADLGCGSGASTSALLAALRETGSPFRVEGVDGSAGMLEAARAKEWPDSVSFTHAQAEDLPDAGTRYDAVFAAYLLRNVPDRDAFLHHVWRSLRPGGVLVVHDYGVAGRPLDVAAWTALSWGIIIPSAAIVTRKRPNLFTYLWRSVLEFDSDEQLQERLTRAGFTDVGLRPVPGWQSGMVRTLWGRRP